MIDQRLLETNVIDALRRIPAPSDYSTWRVFMLNAKRAGMDFETFDRWSANAHVGHNTKNNRKIWNLSSVGNDRGRGAGYIFKMAKLQGWEMPPELAKALAEESGRGYSAPRQAAPEKTAKEEEASKNAVAYVKQASAKASGVLEYLAGRGITAETAKRFNLGYDEKALFSNKNAPGKTACPALVIPYPGSDYYQTRNLQIKPNSTEPETVCKCSYPAGLKRQLFNVPALRKGGVVFVVEGQLDAVSIEQAGFNAIAWGGSGGTALLEEELRKGVTAEAFVIVPDADDEGDKQAGDGLQMLMKNGYQAYTVEVPEGVHDANDYLWKDAPDFSAWLAECAAKREEVAKLELEEYRRKTPAGSVTEFLESLNRGVKVTPTGWADLDAALGGGLVTGFVILGAMSSMGKTTFCLQMADQIAARDDRDILYIALEQGKEELMAKSISRRAFLDYCVTDGGRTVMRKDEYGRRSPASRKALGKAFPFRVSSFDLRTKWSKMADKAREALAFSLEAYAGASGRRIYYHEARGAEVTASDIRKAVTDHKAKTGNSPIVIVDYLQLLAAETITDKMGRLIPKTATERDTLNYNLGSMTAISRDFDTIVIGISAFNRSNYHTDAGMDAFNGSSRLEYSSDVLLAIQPDGGHEKVSDLDDIWDGRKYRKDGVRTNPGVINCDRFKKVFQDKQGPTGGVMPMAVKILKNRGCPVGGITFDYFSDCDTFVCTGKQAKELERMEADSEEDI